MAADALTLLKYVLLEPNSEILLPGKFNSVNAMYSLWSIILTTLFSVTSGFGSVIHIEYMDFVPELGW